MSTSFSYKRFFAVISLAVAVLVVAFLAYLGYTVGAVWALAGICVALALSRLVFRDRPWYRSRCVAFDVFLLLFLAGALVYLGSWVDSLAK